MLLRDARSTGLPAFAEVVQVGDEKIAQERVEAQGRERPVENRLGRGLVEALERFCKELESGTAAFVPGARR